MSTNGFFGASEEARLRRLNNCTHYRGPDDSGQIVLNLKGDRSNGGWDVFLGNRRLAILDCSPSGHQPMTDGRGNWITFNGEIFNYVELRAALEAKGHLFRTGTDTEVILHLYEEYGERSFDQLNGMWAFAIADTKRKKLVLSRDRFSIKPLYILQTSECTYFASEVKQLIPLLSSRTLNQEAMSAFLAQGLLDHSSETFFQGIELMPARHNRVFSLSDGSVKESEYWQFQQQVDSTLTRRDAIQRFRDLFLDSVRIRLRSDVKVGVLLSGGLDSSAIAVACRQVASSPLETYSVISDDARFDEREYINVVAATGIPNAKIVFGPSDLIEDLDHVLYHSDQPVAGFSVVAQYKLFREIKQLTDTVVLLSGQGGDEVLLGYLKFFFFYLKLLARESRYPDLIAQVAASMWHGTVVRQFTWKAARRYLRGTAPSTSGLKLRATREPIWRCENMVSRQVADIERYSVPVLAHYEDRNSMAHSLEVRHPFLDHRLVNFVLSLPLSLKLHHGWTKYILREAIHEMPSRIRWRRDKQSFVTPEEKWLKEDLSELIPQMFRSSVLSQAGILDDRQFLESYARFRSGAPISYAEISRTVIAERWMQRTFS